MLLLTYRAAMARSLTVEEWQEQTPEQEKPYWLALVWMDAHGEQWAEVAAMVHNTTRTDANDCRSPQQWLRLKRYRADAEMTADQIEASRSAFAALALGGYS